MEAIKRLFREYNLVSAAVTATVAFALIMGWIDLTDVQMGGLLGLLAAWMLVIRFLVTPVSDPTLPVGTIVNANSPNLPTSEVTPIAPPA